MKRLFSFGFLALALAMLTSCGGTFFEPDTASNDESTPGPIMVRPGNAYHPPVYCGMEPGMFNTLIHMVRKEIGDSDKKQPALAAANSNHFTAQQLKALMAQFSFDDAKIELARKACPNLCDRQNAFIIYETATFSSNKDSLRSICQ